MQNNSIQLTLKQQQKLSPMQMQVIKMLEYPSIELEERIREEMVENPALEITDADVADDGCNEEYREEERPSADDLELAWIGDGDDFEDKDDIPNFRLHINNRSADDSTYRREQSNGLDLGEFLLEQLHTLKLTEQEMLVGEYLVGNVDDKGYIRREVEGLADDFATTDVNPTERRLGIITPWAPAHSAERRMAPRLWGSFSSSRMMSVKMPSTAVSALTYIAARG